MGMDVYGKKPKNDNGEYFRSNVWYWRPLWSMIEDLYPALASKVPNAHFNSGDGLNNQDSITLSRLLKKDIESGQIESYIKNYQSQIAEIPKEDCKYCNGLGVRTWDQLGSDPITKTCNACNGTLKVDNILTCYRMDLSLIQEFQKFLENCGGFEIW